METSRERVLKAFNHIQPDNVPVYLMGIEQVGPWLEQFGTRDDLDLRLNLGLDVQTTCPVYTGPNHERGLNIWGQVTDAYGAKGAGYSGQRGGYPLANATSPTDVDRFPWADPGDFDYSVCSRMLQAVPDTFSKRVEFGYAVQAPGQSREDAARGRAGGEWIALLCSLFDLFGMERTLIDLHAEPRIVRAAIGRLEEFTLDFLRRLLDATHELVDTVWYGDDFATQKGMLISPDHWRRFLKPTYSRVFDLIKSYGLKVWFHSCGTFRPVLPDLIDIGMDVWETTQVHLPGNEPETLKREYGQHITFFGAINTQRTLPFGSADDVRAEVRERIRVLGEDGGYICGGDHCILPDVPIANVTAMLDEARKFRF